MTSDPTQAILDLAAAWCASAEGRRTSSTICTLSLIEADNSTAAVMDRHVDGVRWVYTTRSNIFDINPLLPTCEAACQRVREELGLPLTRTAPAPPISVDSTRVAAEQARRALETSFFAGRDSRADALAKLAEEAEEIRAARTPGELEGEIGDAIFVLVRLAAQEGVDPEEALRRAASRFERRIAEATRLLGRVGVDASSATLEEWELAWKTVKRLERAGGER